jgi:integrase
MNHLKRWDALRLDRITVADVEALRTEMRAAGYVDRTANVVTRIAGAVFKAAIARDECMANPIARLDRAFTPSIELDADDTGTEDQIGDILSPDEIRQLLSSLEADLFLRTLTAMAFITGARQGELLGLAWDHVDLDEGRIRIARSVGYARKGSEAIAPRFYPPKTKAGRRTIAIPPELVSMLRMWKLACPPSELGLVFPDEAGQPFRCAQLLRRRFHPALKRAGLRQVKFHSLRHSCASTLIAEGAPVTEVQHQLGHKNPAITLSVYSHWFKRAQGSTSTNSQLAAAVLGESGHQVGTEAAIQTKVGTVARMADHRKINAA